MSKNNSKDAAGPSESGSLDGSTKPITLGDAHQVFRRWLGQGYDTDALDAVLAAAAVERLDGDTVWLLVVSGSGNAKTETVQALDGIGAMVTSTISSPGALLSGTSRKEQTTDATGGLLRRIGDRGVLVIKDMTSVLSMSREMRAETLGALREVYDGRWSRNIGTDGGRTLEWRGRVVVVGAVTTAWDRANAVIASMGDRFVLVRVDSGTGRLAAGRQAIANTGSEVAMRTELAEAVAGVMAGVSLPGVQLTRQETDVLLAAADLVTRARTGVEYDRGKVIEAHAPEMPTRFAKQLAQVVRGAVALGMDRAEALRLAVRCARDSMSPLRLALVDDLARHPGSTTTEVRKRVDLPHSSVDRELQALHMLHVVTVHEQAGQSWRYSLGDEIDPQALAPQSVSRNVSRCAVPDSLRERGATDISGNEDGRGVWEPPQNSVASVTGVTVRGGKLGSEGLDRLRKESRREAKRSKRSADRSVLVDTAS